MKQIQAKPFISVIVNNYNYGRFLARAIDSALDQAFSEVEVLVVDDGSTDGSRELIEAYGDAVLPVFKTNGGQASALNAGYERAMGEWILFLDADDELVPESLSRLTSSVRSVDVERCSKLHWYMQAIDREGSKIEGRVYPGRLPAETDLCDCMLSFAHYPTPPMSGNLFNRRFLEKIMPIPDEEWRLCADSYLSVLAPLYGDVVPIFDCLSYYRLHGNNHWSHGARSVEDLHAHIENAKRWQALVLEHAQGLGFRSDAMLNVPHLPLDQLALELLDADSGFESLTSRLFRWRLALEGVRVQWEYPHAADVRLRLKHSLWAVLVGGLPRIVARPLARWTGFQKQYSPFQR